MKIKSSDADKYRQNGLPVTLQAVFYCSDKRQIDEYLPTARNKWVIKVADNGKR
jgi:hypothetical protein